MCSYCVVCTLVCQDMPGYRMAQCHSFVDCAGRLWVAMNLTATVATVVSGRSDLSDYITYGHCALDKGSPAEQYAAACTLAYAYDDWALAVRN